MFNAASVQDGTSKHLNCDLNLKYISYKTGKIKQNLCIIKKNANLGKRKKKQTPDKICTIWTDKKESIDHEWNISKLNQKKVEKRKLDIVGAGLST